MTGWRFSPLTRRILIVNVVPLAVLAAGILYLADYRERLIDAELLALGTQAEIFAGAIAEGAVEVRGDGTRSAIESEPSLPLLRRLVAPTRTRARVYGPDRRLLADSRFLGDPRTEVKVDALPPEDIGDLPRKWLSDAYEVVTVLLLDRRRGPPFPEAALDRLDALPAMAAALDGERRSAVWSLPNGGLRFGVAVPIQRFKRVLGVMFVTSDAQSVAAAVRYVRVTILQVFGAVLAVTILVSLYLARTITRPVRRLAAAADSVDSGRGQAPEIPDLERRRDEIGDLSKALRRMTETLWQRMTANERFAADMAHEIRNPLTSLRSAVETVSRVSDDAQRAELTAIIEDDVRRLDRLITDISDVSRLDVELARSRMRRVDLGRLLPMLADAHESADGNGPAPRVRCTDANVGGCMVMGIESRLMQVFDNLILNARSFTPSRGSITLSVRCDGDHVVAEVEDDGAGIPPESLDSVFERFYSDRPPRDGGRRHSGLGLSISRQIAEAHGGTIHAENRLSDDGRILGARFVVRLPAVA